MPKVARIINVVVMVCLKHLVRKNYGNHKEICLQHQSLVKDVGSYKRARHLTYTAYPYLWSSTFS